MTEKRINFDFPNRMTFGSTGRLPLHRKIDRSEETDLTAIYKEDSNDKNGRLTEFGAAIVANSIRDVIRDLNSPLRQSSSQDTNGEDNPN